MRQQVGKVFVAYQRLCDAPYLGRTLSGQTVEEGSRAKGFGADAADTLYFKDLLYLLPSLMVVRALLVHTPPLAGFALTGSVDMMLRNLALERDEIDGLMAGPMTSKALLTRAAHHKAKRLAKSEHPWAGRHCASELRRNHGRG